MGVIDTNHFSVKCLNPQCGETEDAHVNQKGSAYGGSWGDPPTFSKFIVTWKGDEMTGPRIEAAVCKKCGTSATHTLS